MVARNAVLSALRRGKVDTGRAWIISSNPRAEHMFPFHSIVTVDPGRQEVERRVRQGARPEHFLTLANDWYEARTGNHNVNASREW
jgi:hypothetical protein